MFTKSRGNKKSLHRCPDLLFFRQLFIMETCEIYKLSKKINWVCFVPIEIYEIKQENELYLFY